MIRKNTVLLVLVGALLIFQATGLRAQTINVDMSQEHQVIRGFGGIHINSWTGQVLTTDMQEKAFGNDPGKIGLSILRMRIDPNKSGWGSELPIAQYAKSKGAIVFASPWNPPASMRAVLTETDDYTDYYLLPDYYDDYAAYLNEYVDYMDNNGVPLYAISMQNEPDWHDWTRWTTSQMIKFLKENAPTINCRLIAPESLGYIRTTIDPLLKDADANAQIDILGTHLYGTTKANYYYPLAYEKNKEIWMTEHILGNTKPEDNTWALALTLAEEINTCMDANMSAYVYWYIRRYYGLINDGGNITDKGYVMSQFSKFIRPGAHRVEVELSGLSNVSATAYKNDSEVVLVVVNNNSSSKAIDVDLANLMSGVESLTQFTTSDVKKVVNDGAIAINSGNFSATVDARSITTFTSNPQQGGKQGNVPPVASAGGDQEIQDIDGTPINVSLKGSESSDEDGEIVNYSWAQDGNQIATTADLELLLSVGNYSYQLTVTDNDGATNTITVNVSITTDMTEEIWLEAECATVGSNWAIETDAAASNGSYVVAPNGTQSLSAASTDLNDLLTFDFHVTEAGSFKVWGRVITPSADDDSYYVQIDESSWATWNGIPTGNEWHWDDVHSGYSNSDPAVVYELDTGYHTLNICFREDGAKLDKIYLTNTGLTPDGIGADAFNCEEEIDTSDVGVAELAYVGLCVYPNPVKSVLNIESHEPFSSIRIYSMNGVKLLEENYSEVQKHVEIQVDFGKGMYMLQVVGLNSAAIRKFVVED